MARNKTKKTKKTTKTQPTTVTFRLDPELRPKLQALAETEYTSESALCNRFISQMLKADVPDRLSDVERRLAVLEATPRDLIVRPQMVMEMDLSSSDRTTASETDADEADREDTTEGNEGAYDAGSSDASDGVDHAVA